jgi:MacB-like periplasmic core domain
MIQDLRDGTRALTRHPRFVMSDPGPAQEVDVDAVTSQFFQALGVPALYGRALLLSDANAEPGTPPAVLSYSFWKRRFGGDPRVVKGQVVVVDKHHFAIVGVMPEDFHGLWVDRTPDLWIPFRAFLSLLDVREHSPYVEVAGLLKPGVTRLQAQAECRTVWQSTMKDYYQRRDKNSPQTAQEMFRLGVALQSLARGTSILREQFGGVLELLMASVGVLLLIVCSNVARAASGARSRKRAGVCGAAGGRRNTAPAGRGTCSPRVSCLPSRALRADHSSHSARCHWR